MMAAMLEQAKLEQAKHPEMTLEQLLWLKMHSVPALQAQAKVALADHALGSMLAAPPQVPSQPQVQATEAPTESSFAVLRFGRPAEEIRRELRQVGLPWFLRRLGATGRFDDRGDISIDVVVQGKSPGRYIERLVPIDADRSKLFVAFVPADAALLRNLVASIKTVYDPVSLMRVAMMEHTRSSLAGESFNLRVLDGPPKTSGGSFLERLNSLGMCPPPQTDDFPLCDRDRDAAKIRHATRAKAGSAGRL